MKAETLSDLQSLAFKVRSPQSRQNITEAIQAYYGGAYRSALMSVWVAVAFDIFEKIGELAMHSDPQAKQYQKDLHDKVQQQNVVELQKIEQELLSTACNAYEFISKEQLLQFERLKTDRNYCAHPAFTSDGGAFQPSPELVRFYIVYAVDNLLSVAPVRGKSSLEAITIDIWGDVFPPSPEAAGKFLEEKYLKYAKIALIHNLFRILLKGALADIPEWAPHRSKAVVALRGLAQTKASVHDHWMKDNFSKVCDTLTDKQILKVIGFVAGDKRFWDWMGEHHRVQLQAFLDDPRFLQISTNGVDESSGWGQIMTTINQYGRTSLSASLGLREIHELFKMMDVTELKPRLISLFDKLDDDGKLQVIREAPWKELCDKAIMLFGEVGSYRSAERYGSAILPSIAPLLDAQQIESVFLAVLDNGQISAAGKMDSILCEFVTILSQRKDIKLGEALKWREVIRSLIQTYDNYGGLEKILLELRFIESSDVARAS